MGLTPRGVLTLAALAASCRPWVLVGVASDEPSRDAGPTDVSTLTASDVARDAGSPDAADVPTAPPGRLGLGDRGLAVAIDGERDESVIRFVYVGDDGALHVERRVSETLARDCSVQLPPPPGFSFASGPAVPNWRSDVVVATQEGQGDAVGYHVAPSSDVVGTCGYGFGSWVALPPAPDGRRFASAPAAISLTAASPPGHNEWVVAVTDDERVMSAERVGAERRWSRWLAWPPLPGGERVVAAPAAVVSAASTFTVVLTTASGDGRRRFRALDYDTSLRAWTPAWTEIEGGEAAPDSSLGRTLFELDARYREGPWPYGAWHAYRDSAGRIWTQGHFDRRGVLGGFSAWADRGNPFGDIDAKPSAPRIAPRRDARRVAGEILFLVVSESSPRRVRYLSAWHDLPSVAAWREAPDSLR